MTPGKIATTIPSTTTASARMIAVRRPNHFRRIGPVLLSSEALEQPVDVVALDLRPRPLAGAPAQLIEDLARLLDVARVGNGDVALGGAVARALAAERVAISVAPRSHAARIAGIGIALSLS